MPISDFTSFAKTLSLSLLSPARARLCKNLARTNLPREIFVCIRGSVRRACLSLCRFRERMDYIIFLFFFVSLFVAFDDPDDDDDQKWTAKKKADCTLWRRQKVPQPQNFTKRVVWTVEKKISHRRSNNQRDFCSLGLHVPVCSFGFPQKNTP